MNGGIDCKDEVMHNVSYRASVCNRLAAVPVHELQHPTRCHRCCETDTFTALSYCIDHLIPIVLTLPKDNDRLEQSTEFIMILTHYRIVNQQSAMMKTDAGTCASLSVSLLTTSFRLSNHFLLYTPIGLQGCLIHSSEAKPRPYLTASWRQPW